MNDIVGKWCIGVNKDLVGGRLIRVSRIVDGDKPIIGDRLVIDRHFDHSKTPPKIWEVETMWSSASPATGGQLKVWGLDNS